MMENTEPKLEEIQSLTGITLLEFGASWCGYCQAAQPTIAAVLAQFPQVRHLKIEDGKGRRMGRLFAVKLWPTLVVLREGNERARMVREVDAKTLSLALEHAIDGK